MDILDGMTLEQLRAHMRKMQTAIDDAKAALEDGRRGDALKALKPFASKERHAPFGDDLPPGFASA